MLSEYWRKLFKLFQVNNLIPQKVLELKECTAQTLAYTISSVKIMITITYVCFIHNSLQIAVVVFKIVLFHATKIQAKLEFLLAINILSLLPVFYNVPLC